MASVKIVIVSLLVCVVAYVCAVPVEMVTEDTDTPEERQIIRRVTAQRAVFPGLGGFYGGLGGLGLGGLYGMGGLGYGGFFDEDQEPSTENDHFVEDEMTSNAKALVIPGHMIRQLKIRLNNNADIGNLNTEMGAASTDSQKEWAPTDNLKKWISTGSQKKWASRVPHSKFRKLAKHMAKIAATNTDTDATNMSNEESQQEFRVIRVPSNVFKMLKNRYQQDVQEAFDQEMSE